MNPRYPMVAQRAGHRCEYCRAPEVIFNFPFEVEHITPRAADGGDDTENLSLACRSCNVHKADRRECQDAESDDVVSLFHPRIDTWEEHFQWDIDSGFVVGLSAIGRGTIECLQFNSEANVRARRQWARLGLYP